MTWLDKLKKAGEEATKGPWVLSDHDGGYEITAPTGECILDQTPFYPSAPGYEDSEFITISRNCWDEIVKVLETLDEETLETISYDLPTTAEGIGEALAALKAKVEGL